jgi:hypothetical protein
MKNVADKSQVKQAEYKQKRMRDIELDDVRHVLSTPNGRRYMWRYLAECGVFQTSFDGSSRTYFREGERNIGLKILADINEAQPEAYVTMLKEAQEMEKKTKHDLV